MFGDREDVELGGGEKGKKISWGVHLWGVHFWGVTCGVSLVR